MASEIETLKDSITESGELLSEIESELDEAIDAFLTAGKALRAARKRIAALQKKLERATENAESIEEQLAEQADQLEANADKIAELEAELASTDQAALPVRWTVSVVTLPGTVPRRTLENPDSKRAQ